MCAAMVSADTRDNVLFLRPAQAVIVEECKAQRRITQNGKGAMITLVGPTVTINNGALTVI